MNLYGLKNELGYCLVTSDKEKLDKYKKNILFPVVKLKMIKNEKEKYYLFTKEDGDIVVTDNPITNRELVAKYEGTSIKIDLREN